MIPTRRNQRKTPPSEVNLTAAAGSAIGIFLAAAGLIFLSLPLLALILRALQGGLPDLAVSGIPQALLLSFVTTLATAAITVIVGTPIGYLLARREFRFKRVIGVFIELPIVLPPAVAGLALLIAYGRRGMVGSLLADIGITLPFTIYAVIMAQTFVAAPFYIRAAQIGFSAVPREIEEAGRVDGASGWTLFRWITLPVTFQALAAGLILSWARALGEFGATILFAGSLQGRTQTMPLLIYNVIERDINAAIWTGVILIGLAALALFVSSWLTRPRDQA